MALVKCSECGNEISTQAKTCPKCGAPQVKKPQGLPGWVVLVTLGAVVWFIMGQFNGGAGGGQVQAVATAPEVDLLSVRCEEAAGGVSVVIGEARNASSRRFQSLWLVAGFYDASGKVIDTQQGVADVQPLMPGQKTTFKMYGPRNPMVKSCGLTAAKDGPFGDVLRIARRG